MSKKEIKYSAGGPTSPHIPDHIHSDVEIIGGHEIGGPPPSRAEKKRRDDFHIAAMSLGKKVAGLCEGDVEDAGGALRPVAFVGDILEVVGKDWAVEHGLIRYAGRLANPEQMPPNRWVLEVLTEHPDPASVFDEAFPTRTSRLYALRIAIMNFMARSIHRTLGGVQYLDGQSLKSAWEALPARARAVYPDGTADVIKALAAVTPAGELPLSAPSTGRNIIPDLGHALMLNATLCSWLRGQAKSTRKKGSKR